MANRLYSQAAPVPMAIRVNMFRLRRKMEFQPRWKNGHPAHSTTGVASSNCTQLETCGDIRLSVWKKWLLISRIKTGSANINPSQKRRFISSSSAEGSLSAVISSGSSAIPQIGQSPGPCC